MGVGVRVGVVVVVVVLKTATGPLCVMVSNGKQVCQVTWGQAGGRANAVELMARLGKHWLSVEDKDSVVDMKAQILKVIRKEGTYKDPTSTKQPKDLS